MSWTTTEIGECLCPPRGLPRPIRAHPAMTDLSTRQRAAEQALLWWAHLRQPGVGADVEQQFFAWLQASPVHVEEYLRVAAQAPSLPSLATGSPDPAVPVKHRVAGDRGPFRRIWAHPVSWGVLVGVLLSAIGLLPRPHALDTTAQPTEHLLTTRHAEVRTWTLDDGSVIKLGPDSVASERYSPTERLVQLRTGHADFHVAKGDRRRFRVAALGASVVATGTRFDVNLDEQRDVVTLIEGRVVVYANAMDGEGVNQAQASAAQPLVPGQQVSIAAGWVSVPTRVDLHRIEAWKQGQIIADGLPLAVVVREFNHYGHRPIRIEDRNLAATRLSGVFNARDDATFLAFLDAELGVEAVSVGPGLLLQARVPTARVQTTEVK